MPNYASTKLNKIINLLLVFVYVGVAFLSVLNLVGTNTLATEGVVLDDLSRQIENNEKENQSLEVEINKLSNLSYIEKAAGNLGFQKITSKVIISSEETVASLFDRR